MGQVIDFDKFREEQAGEPVQLKIGGQTYDLPPSLPAAVALDIIRIRKEVGEDAPIQPEEMEEMARGVFGDVLFGELMRMHRLTLDELGDLMKQILQLYNPGGPDRPNRAERRKRRK